ncbi:MAG: hypothetical protein DWG76_02150 [Chloroflexi bacterium]|nr:hypothetical protein [Chloroflexota bacterium]
MLRSPRIKRVLGHLPLAAEIDWALHGRKEPVGGFKLEGLRATLPEWVRQAVASPLRAQSGKKVLLYATLHYWLEHAALSGLALAGLGHNVTLAYSPYSNWRKPVSKFDLRRRELYTRDLFQPAKELIHLESLLTTDVPALPTTLAAAVERVSIMDTQYTLQVEEVDRTSQLYQLRLARNTQAAAAALRWIEANQPDVVIVPNGLILEFGAVFQAAQHAGVPAVSYEFGEQRGRIWLAQDASVMLQDTDAMWAARRNLPFDDAQREKVRALFATRQQAGLFQNFYRKWQDVPSEGAQKVRARLNLDARPVVLLAANVIGDSLTLGRATFSGDMSTWLRRTLEFFAARQNVQFVLRVHPGERNLDGPSVADLVAQILPKLPAHMRLVAAGDPVNTYDLIEAADLGMVYTTTVGLEMAMSGLPVIVVGQTHYRSKGFTRDPHSWEEYFADLEASLADLSAARPTPEQVDTAWHYAYRFFFDYPQPFPWHLLHFAEDTSAVSPADLFSPEGQGQYAASFDYLTGTAFEWNPS